MPFEVALPDAVKDQLSHLPRDVRQRIARGIKTLQDFPFPRGNTIRRVQGTNRPIYRLRIGDYRVVYHLDVARKWVIVTSFSVSTVEHSACLFKTLVKPEKQAGSMFYSSSFVHN